MPKLRNGSKGTIQTRALSIASPAFCHWATALNMNRRFLEQILINAIYFGRPLRGMLKNIPKSENYGSGSVGPRLTLKNK